MTDIVLSTINARYSHASLGLRYLQANMGELAARTQILEFVLGQRPLDLVETILSHRPRIVGLGVYIWNVEETTRVVALLKRIAPDVVIVLGGPEVSYEVDDQAITRQADYTITGWGELSFAALCRELLSGGRPSEPIISGVQAPLEQITLPYHLYTDDDIAKRFLYVEASRGCPFKCEFCLSSLDKTAWPFDLDRFMVELAQLHERGARHFRFVDRTFNLKASAGVRILEFFLERMDERLFVHFEVIPDHLPDTLKAAIAHFPEGALQFEIGIQTWNPEVQALISRRQDNDKSAANFQWLRGHSKALIHADLIVGLPGEDIESFGRGFDRLWALRPHEIQVGILKRLRGTPIERHSAAFDMRYNPDPPYNILSTRDIDFAGMQRMARFARYWELVANSGRFRRALPLMLGDAPFRRFLEFSDWVFATTSKTHQIGLESLFDLVSDHLLRALELPQQVVRDALTEDYAASGARGRPAFLTKGLTVADDPNAKAVMHRASNRQTRHVG